MDELERTELEEQLEEQFPQEPEESGEPSPEDTEQPARSEEPASPQTYEIDGQQLSEDQLRVAARFKQWTDQNPDKFAKIVEWERAGYDPTVFAPQAASEPAEDEEIDPYSEEYLKGLHDRLKAMETENQTRAQAERGYALQAGMDQFVKSHADLSDADRDKVFQWVYENELLSTIPVNKIPVSRIPSEVASRLEAGYRNVFWEKAQSEAATKIVSDQQKRRRAASTSSSPVSASRTPEMNTKEDRHNWMIDTLKEALSENP